MTDPVLPDDREYLGREEFQVRIAPRRRAWLVDEGSVDQLRRALYGAASLWGGLRCPILPVDTSGEVASGWLQVAELLGVTEVVDFTGGDRVQSTWTHGAHRDWLVVPARPLDDSSFWNLHPLAAQSATDLPGRGIFLPGDSSLVSLAGPGGFGLVKELQLFRDSSVSIVENCDHRTMAKAQIAGTTCLAKTQTGDFPRSPALPS
jgi:hypothetical protein